MDTEFCSEVTLNTAQCPTGIAPCPVKKRLILEAWSASIVAEGDRTFAEDFLYDVGGALVTLAHDNVSVSRSTGSPFARISALDFDDTGGYFAARRAIVNLIRSAPVSKDVPLALAQFNLRRIVRNMRCLEKLIPG